MYRRSMVLVTLVVALTLAAAAAAGCGASTSNGSGPQDSTANHAVGDTTAIGVSVYPGTEPEEVYSGVFKMTTPDSFDKVIGFYRRELPQATFSQISIDTGRGASFLVDSEDFHGNVSVEENLPSDGQVTITVSKIRT